MRRTILVTPILTNYWPLMISLVVFYDLQASFQVR